MNHSKTFLTAAGLVALAATTQSNAMDMGEKSDMEKCYGVAKEGKNDCANASGTHSCAGHATKDGEGGEWIFVPKGTCDKLVGGSTEPKT